MHVMSIVGTRPQLVKLAPISWSIQGKIPHKILHTGQHYDPLLFESFMKELKIPDPDFQLQVGSGSHGLQTGKMLSEIEKVLIVSKPDHVIVYGDTNTTLAGAIAASKLHIPISHIEAGLRSFNRKMPEEINRVLTDHCSNLLFAPTENAMSNLEMEGLNDIAYLSGDVMVETLNYAKTRITGDVSPKSYLVATIHRAENTDDKERLRLIITRMRQSPIPIHLHCHPRLEKNLKEFNLNSDSENLKLFPPIDYFSLIAKILNACGVITDSGGLQKESYILDIPCLVVRAESEWIETTLGGWREGGNLLDPELQEINKEWWSKKMNRKKSSIFGDGTASTKIISKIIEYIESSESK